MEMGGGLVRLCRFLLACDHERSAAAVELCVCVCVCVCDVCVLVSFSLTEQGDHILYYFEKKKEKIILYMV